MIKNCPVFELISVNSLVSCPWWGLKQEYVDTNNQLLNSCSVNLTLSSGSFLCNWIHNSFSFFNILSCFKLHILNLKTVFGIPLHITACTVYIHITVQRSFALSWLPLPILISIKCFQLIIMASKHWQLKQN